MTEGLQKLQAEEQAKERRPQLTQLDEATLRRAYVGHWQTREAFGLELLDDAHAERSLIELPRWLRPYVRLDGDAYVADLEASGVYVLAASDDGVLVFDGGTLTTEAQL